MNDARLRAALGAEPPSSVASLPAGSQAELAVLIESARQTQADDLEVAFEGVVRHVPFPVRGIARRMLRG